MTRLPPNQQLVARDKWPITGEKAPRRDDRPWTVTIVGEVDEPREFSVSDLLAMPQQDFELDIHCVTRWSKLGATFSGVLIPDLIALAAPRETAQFVSFVARSERNHSTSLPLADVIELGTFAALHYEGAPLPTEHGGPVRTVTPGRYFYKSLKWLERIELLSEDRLGYWEAETGYHNTADPWLEQRYLAPTLSRQEARQAIDRRDFAGKDLRSINASGRDLAGLSAGGAQLRDADFRKCNLREANFRDANLSNARLQQADLRGADFTNADVEGADFAGCDLSGAVFSGASLFGATFVTLDDEGTAIEGTHAKLESANVFDEAQKDALTPGQRQFIDSLPA